MNLYFPPKYISQIKRKTDISYFEVFPMFTKKRNSLRPTQAQSQSLELKSHDRTEISRGRAHQTRAHALLRISDIWCSIPLKNDTDKTGSGDAIRSETQCRWLSLQSLHLLLVRHFQFWAKSYQYSLRKGLPLMAAFKGGSARALQS